MVARSGTRARALHDQWTQFALTEMEAWLWSNFLNTFVLPEEQRITACLEQNVMMFKRSAAVLDRVLAEVDYLVENRFTVTDIIVSYTLNSGRKQGHLGDFQHLQAYLQRLFERPLCTLDQT